MIRWIILARKWVKKKDLDEDFDINSSIFLTTDGNHQEIGFPCFRPKVKWIKEWIPLANRFLEPSLSVFHFCGLELSKTIFDGVVEVSLTNTIPEYSGNRVRFEFLLLLSLRNSLLVELIHGFSTPFYGRDHSQLIFSSSFWMHPFLSQICNFLRWGCHRFAFGHISGGRSLIFLVEGSLMAMEVSIELLVEPYVEEPEHRNSIVFWPIVRRLDRICTSDGWIFGVLPTYQGWFAFLLLPLFSFILIHDLPLFRKVNDYFFMDYGTEFVKPFGLNTWFKKFQMTLFANFYLNVLSFAKLQMILAATGFLTRIFSLTMTQRIILTSYGAGKKGQFDIVFCKLLFFGWSVDRFAGYFTDAALASRKFQNYDSLLCQLVLFLTIAMTNWASNPPIKIDHENCIP